MHVGTNQVWTFTVALSLIEECIVSDLKALARFYMQACNEYTKTNIVLLYTVRYQVYYTSWNIASGSNKPSLVPNIEHAIFA